MTTTRPVRADQHGTMTGYQYGCRCNDCRIARRAYASTHESTVAADIVCGVLAALVREADLDDIATVSARRLGEIAGVSHATANAALHQLAEQGRVSIAGRVGRGGVFEVHITSP